MSSLVFPGPHGIASRTSLFQWSIWLGSWTTTLWRDSARGSKIGGSKTGSWQPIFDSETPLDTKIDDREKVGTLILTSLLPQN